MDASFVNEILFIRMVCTGLVVILVSWSVIAFGSLIGGALAGLPMVIGPAFLFLAKQSAPDFIAAIATYTLLALSATQIFLFTYILLARRLKPLASLGLSIGAWLISAFLCKQLPENVWLGCGLFLTITIFFIWKGRPLLKEDTSFKNQINWGMLVFRGTLAGILVASVTTFSEFLGASNSGVILAFPIGYAVIAITIHQKIGISHVINTLHAALFGSSSLAAFCLIFVLFLNNVNSMAALSIATIASVLTTVVLILVSRAKFP